MSIFVTSDLHLDHTNIIRYCNRPFSSVEEMNKTLIDNWNAMISPIDIVIFVGDFCRTDPTPFLAALNGFIVFVKGNHDKRLEGVVDLHDSIKFRQRGIQFLFIHDPKDAPKGSEGWVIHGHHHNNYPGEFPFFNREKKRINVSVEMTDYRPLLLDDICEMITSQVEDLPRVSVASQGRDNESSQIL